MDSRPLELSLTESFAKHKRNLLLVSAIVLILVVASPSSVKLPGLGTDEAVPSAIAYFMLGSTLLYFFAAYFIELLAVRARNLEATATAEFESVSARLHATLNDMQDDIAQVRDRCRQMKEVLTELPSQLDEAKALNTVDRFSEKINAVINSIDQILSQKADKDVYRLHSLDSQLETIKGSVDRSVSDLKSGVVNIDKGIGSLTKIQDEVLIKMKDVENAANKLTGKFDRISRRIHVSQRLGFSAVEQAIPIFLAAISFFACVDGAFFGSGGASVIRGYVPAIAESQPVAVPKVGTQSTGTRQNP